MKKEENKQLQLIAELRPEQFIFPNSNHAKMKHFDMWGQFIEMIISTGCNNGLFQGNCGYKDNFLFVWFGMRFSLKQGWQDRSYPKILFMRPKRFFT